MEEACVTRLKVAHVTTIDLTLRNLLLAQLVRLRDDGYDVVGVSAPGPWVADLEREGIRHIAWTNATRSWSPRADARAFAELVSIFKRERFDLVHLHNPKPAVMGRIAGRIARIPCVLNTVHGLYATPDDRLRKKIPVLGLEMLTTRLSDLELYQSEEDLDWARRRHLVSRARSDLLGNGADLSQFHPGAVSEERRREVRHELGIPADALVVGTIGRMVVEKGYREFFAAARTVRASMPQVHFVAVGDRDPDKSDALGDDEIDAAASDVVMAGWREDVPDVIAALDVFVLASWREGMPRSAIEAAAMGKALVLTDIRGCREVARHDVEGLLVPVRSSNELAGAISRVLADESLRRRLGDAARERAVERFDESRVAAMISSVTRAALDRRGLVDTSTGALR
jgi:glycosyltransferase involved in cell wall biosynthesis